MSFSSKAIPVISLLQNTGIPQAVATAAVGYAGICGLQKAIDHF